MVLCVYCKLRALVLRPSINLKCDYIYIRLCPCLLYVTITCSSALPVVYTSRNCERNQHSGRNVISICHDNTKQLEIHFIRFILLLLKSKKPTKKSWFNLVSNSEALNWLTGLFDGMVALLNLQRIYLMWRPTRGSWSSNSVTKSFPEMCFCFKI